MHQHFKFRIILTLSIFTGILTIGMLMGFCLKGKNLSDISISRRAINIKSQNSEFHNRNVVVKGIKFETLIPIPVVALPNHGEETPIQVGVRITNHTSKPYRFHLQYFLPEVLNPSRKPLEIDFGRNVTSEAQDSDIPLIFPGKSVSYLINARLGRNSEKCTALSGNAIYGGVWTFQCLIPGNSEVRFEYIPVLQGCPHPPAPSPKTGEGEPDSKSLSRPGRGI